MPHLVEVTAYTCVRELCVALMRHWLEVTLSVALVSMSRCWPHMPGHCHVIIPPRELTLAEQSAVCVCVSGGALLADCVWHCV